VTRMLMKTVECHSTFRAKRSIARPPFRVDTKLWAGYWAWRSLFLSAVVDPIWECGTRDAGASRGLVPRSGGITRFPPLVGRISLERPNDVGA
jgi:hypothetical protein